MLEHCNHSSYDMHNAAFGTIPAVMKHDCAAIWVLYCTKYQGNHLELKCLDRVANSFGKNTYGYRLQTLKVFEMIHPSRKFV